MSDSRFGIDPAAVCPYCGHATDAASGLTTRARPAVGDFSVCFYCASVAVFTVTGDRLRQRRADPAELRELLADDTVRSVVDGIRRYRGTGAGC